ncbi:Transposase [Vibrio ordalii]
MAQRRWQIELMGVNLTTRGQVSEINRKAVMNKKTALKWRCVL